MFSQSYSCPLVLKSLRITLQLVIRKAIFSISATSIFTLLPVAIASSQVSTTPPTQLQTYTTKTQLLTQFPHHTSASSTLGFLVTNYSVYCQTNGSDTIDISTIKPLCGGVGGEEITPQVAVAVDNTSFFLTTPLEPIVLFQNDKAILLLGDL